MVQPTAVRRPYPRARTLLEYRLEDLQVVTEESRGLTGQDLWTFLEIVRMMRDWAVARVAVAAVVPLAVSRHSA